MVSSSTHRPRPFCVTKITITNQGRTASYELTEESCIDAYRNENNEVYTFQGLDGKDGSEWLFVAFVLGKKL